MRAGYDPELPGLDEARLDGYRGLIISKIGLLNTALQRDRVREIGEITAAMVEIGDSESARELSTGPIRIRIVAGGDENGIDFEARLDMASNTGYRYDFSTNRRVSSSGRDGE